MGARRGTTARGYGWGHQTMRRQWQPFVAAGLAVCWRCGDPIKPDEPWDLGHDDNDRSKYRGPEHAGRCNRAAAARSRARRPTESPHPGLLDQGVGTPDRPSAS